MPLLETAEKVTFVIGEHDGGENMDYEGVVEAIEKTGAVVHSLDHLAAGDRIIESVPRRR
ncbi:hypothetical protein AD953_12805, partial [Acetobacter malorum]